MNAELLDLRNLPCPLPVLRLQQALNSSSSLQVVINNPATERDMVNYCRSHRLSCRVAPGNAPNERLIAIGAKDE
jgi:TusA-related sulfurtransferase